ncbi:hypothetical protein C5167_000250 [Papaver somniferum]|uniref:Tify domain-containing protein n=1 Tax=Papaver somniferum TaxID=3469 RepID=A0A4Y7KRY3_PAPSO|nr:uncharacterized protein LOC113307833 [Papaver somniferum]XP_026412079.1 uncharacterized protein LOC113307833 [Papaver somniferum]RZC76103.1 hypothetical protein C5167_000250 [Papaver somniferum]
MSFENKAFWADKDNGGLPDDQVAYDNPSKTETKRQYNWLFDPTEADLFPNKKQAIDATNSRLYPGVLTTNVSTWENGTNLEPGTGQQFSDQVFGSEPATDVSFDESNVHANGSDNLIMGRSVEDQFRNDASVALSMSQDYNGSSLNYGGIRRVKINQVRDSDCGVSISMGHNYQVNDTGDGMPFSMVHAYLHKDDGISVPPPETYQAKESSNNIPVSMYHSMSHSFIKEDQNMISFGGYQEEPITGASDRLINNYDLMMGQHSLVEQQSDMKPEESGLVVPQTEILLNNTTQSGTKKSGNDTKPKTSKKVSPNNNNFPSNVRSLLSTGMLDGVPVKYIAWSQQELRGIVKGSGYLCSCQSCGLSKVLNAFEFERHANCKTKHPNNHIFFENGKSIYAVVQELRSTPQNLLFEVIQTVTGSPINQKSFNLWKESYQAATRELQRIYGKDEKNQALQNEYA